MKFLFNKLYFFLTILLLLVEILIAVYIDDRFIRPYGGDYLVVMLIYCFVKSFTNVKVKPACIFVLLFSYFIEVLQYFKIVKLLHLQHFKIANVVIGTSFSWTDIIAYTAGIISILIIELVIFKREKY